MSGDHTIEDLSPFFDDPCWMCVLLAREAHVGVVLRRGPSNWWRITLWNTKHDTFEGGQWLRGRLYPDKCDVSPDGKLFIYFAGQWRPQNLDKGCRDTWTAVSRPPYFTALTLWPMGDTYGGHGVFLGNQKVSVIGNSASPATHPDHPLGPLEQLDHKPGAEWPQTSWDYGWQRTQPASVRASSSFKRHRGLILGRGVFELSPSGSRKPYTICKASRYPNAIASFEAHWADWDQNGRLVATVGGRVLAGSLNKKNELRWRQLANLSGEKPTRMEAPDWAKHW